MRDERTIVVLEGDETGQELLEEALRVLAPDVIGVELELTRFDLSLAKRRETKNGIVQEAAAAMREAGLGLKAATVTPEGRDDVGSPNRILREEIGGKVIVRTRRRSADHPGAEPRRRHPLRPRAAALRLDRGRGVTARRVRRRLRAGRRDGRGRARHRSLAAGKERREPDGDDPGRRGAARLRR